MDAVVLDSVPNRDTRIRVLHFICIVFAPMFLLSGVARYLSPLVEAVVFAMLLISFPGRSFRPWPSTCCAGINTKREPRRNPLLVRLQKGFEEAFEKFHHSYRGLPEICLPSAWLS